MPRIVQFVNLWSLTDHPSAQRQWSLDRKIKAVADAGFEGISTALTPEHRQLAAKHGLEHLIGFISTSKPEDYPALLRAQKEAGAVLINVQLDDHDTPPAVATRNWIRMVREAEKIGGLSLSLEVHRDTCTETPEKTYEIADRYQKATGEMIRINFDFSHLAVVKHLATWDYAKRLLERPELVQNSDQSHCRPFNGHHCQVPVTYRGKLTEEVQCYLAFVVELFKCWKAAPQNRDATLFVCPEMGPLYQGGGYNVTGLPSSWEDAVVLRGELDKAWRKAR